MKVTMQLKEIMIAKLTKSLLMRLSLDEFNDIFYELNMYHTDTKLFPYAFFKEYESKDNDRSALDKDFITFIDDITTNVVSDFNKGRKLVKILKGIQNKYGDILAYHMCSSSVLVVLLYLYINNDEILTDIKYQVLSSKIDYLKKYLLLVFYIDQLKVKDNGDDILIEFLKRDTYNLLDMDIGVFANVKK